ncbi:AsmA family protein [Microvirga guangxiensis]|uniref:AsmA protein n=1 Tax=Microvirga guangxiensis TaxID=549386 RepID=A0A1G5BCZ4_9HYPH|nr:AsmA-like C-terminal region-containing protein [Microvirga guangxiensis]SCX88012.1 AsmA protein [Microvirga guangxiensis]
MSRRVVFFIALIALAALGAATAPWTLRENGLSSALSDHMKERYGLDLTVEGRSTFAVLPIPRVKFEDVTIRFPDQALKAEGGTLRGEIRVLPLLLGRVELSDFNLSDSKVTASAEALRNVKWNDVFKSRSSALHARRLILSRTAIRWTDLKDADLDVSEFVIRWVGEKEPLTAYGTALWRGERIVVEEAAIHPDRLTTDRISPIELSVIAPTLRLNLQGEAQLGVNPSLTGHGSIETGSMRDFTRWSGMKLPFGSLVQAFSVKGDFSMDRRRLSWPSVAVMLGNDKLEGTMAVRIDTERPMITGTLAADDLNLADLFAPFSQARTSSGAWSEETLDLAHVTGSDLDLRLSAASARLGKLRVEDMAASVLVRPGEIEASIGRAGFHDGTLKGRLSLASIGGETEFKSQGTFAGVEIAPFLASIGEPRWITGHAQGQFSFEGKGRNPVEVVRKAQGRSSVTIHRGELVGIALGDALKRVEKHPLLASLNWKGGRTPFQEAQAQIVVRDGIGEVTEGSLVSEEVMAEMKGQVLMVDRTLNLKAEISPAASQAVPAIAFDIGGGWDNVSISPKARSLIERSGAAKPLLPNRILPNEQRPQATAQ